MPYHHDTLPPVKKVRLPIGVPRSACQLANNCLRNAARDRGVSHQRIRQMYAGSEADGHNVSTMIPSVGGAPPFHVLGC
jgi:hypothetical protein